MLPSRALHSHSGSIRSTAGLRPHASSNSGRETAANVAAHAAPSSRPPPPDNEGQGNSQQPQNWFKSMLDFESWAPRSSRFWRLNQYDYERSTKSNAEAEAAEAGLADLEARVARQRAAASASAMPAPEPPAPVELPAQGSFSEADDDSLSSALSQRIKQMAGPLRGQEEEEDEEEAEAGEEQQQSPPQEALTGDELRLLVYKKYGKTHDLSIVKRSLPGKDFVSLNIMWSHLEQRSFKLTDQQYMEKLESIAFILNSLGQSEMVRATLSAPPRSQNGMPSRPVVGTAVAIQLQLSQGTVNEWFGQM